MTALASIVAALVVFGPAATAAEPPSVLLVTLDAARADHLGLYGGRAATPELERLAASGTRFDNAYAQAPWTLPSLLSMFTGRRPELAMAPSAVGGALGLETLAQRLGGRGYSTAAFVHGLPMDASLGMTRGFSTVRSAEPDRGAAELVRQASRWIASLNGKPYFVWIHAFESHFPYLCPSEFRERYDPGYSGPVHGWGIDEDTRRHGRFVDHFNRVADKRPDPPYAFDRALWEFVPKLQTSRRDVAHFASHYDGCLSYLDEQIGVLGRELRRLGRMRDTVWVVTADHGENLGESIGGRPPALSHPFSDLHEAVLRVPLLIVTPSSVVVRAVEAPVMLLDVSATLLALVGERALAGSQGVDLSAWMRGRAGAPHDGAYASSFLYNGTWNRAFRSGRWKLLREGGRWRLYDLASDPEERIDRSETDPKEFLETARAYLEESARADEAAKR
ncbi:MAG: sulfatase [Elusimicrobia bacterium]|nr:sulfatase [Elusimicrobiota bacterium]